MGEFVKKTVMGYKEASGGLSDPECTHVILTEREYRDLLRQISDAQQEARTTRIDADKEIRESQWRADRNVQKATREREALEAALEAERVESAHQRALNANLLRISRERANADRKLQNKKERSGYVVVYSEEKNCQFRDSRKCLHQVKLWETIIQSPYSVQFTEEVARKQILEDLFCPGHEWLISRIGITGTYNGGYGELQNDKAQNPEDPFYDGNVVIAPQQRFKRNFRSHYWEIAVMHTKPLEEVPEDMQVN